MSGTVTLELLKTALLLFRLFVVTVLESEVKTKFLKSPDMQKNRLTERPFKKTLKKSLKQLRETIYSEGISSKQKILLSERLSEYKSMATDHESENNSNVESRNMWGQKDLHSILRERSDRIFHLENEIEECKRHNLKLMEDRKRVKIDFRAFGSTEQVTEEKNREILSLKSKINLLQNKIRDAEIQMTNDRESIEVWKESNRKLTDLSNQKRVSPVNHDFLAVQPIANSEQELSKLRDLNAELQNELRASRDCVKMQSQRVSNLEKMLKDMENRSKLAQFPANLELSDIESALVEELNGITAAFDNICSTNKALESQIESLVNANSGLVTDIMALKNRIRLLEESRSFIDKERKRLEELRDQLSSESKLVHDRLLKNERQCAEKDKKIAEYRTLLINLQASGKILEKELSTINTAYRSVQDELHELRDDFNSLEIEHQNAKRLCDSFRSVCDGDVVEDLERYKRILRCSLCDSNLKSCVLSKCMHTFCEECISNRFKSRQRKCPNCQTEFSMNDVRKLYL